MTAPENPPRLWGFVYRPAGSPSCAQIDRDEVWIHRLQETVAKSELTEVSAVVAYVREDIVEKEKAEAVRAAVELALRPHADCEDCGNGPSQCDCHPFNTPAFRAKAEALWKKETP